MGKKRRILLLALLVVGGMVWLFFQFTGPPQPVYQGKPLSYWLAAYDFPGNYKARHPNASTPPTHEQADEAIKQMGTNALPILTGMLQHPNFSLKERWLLAMAKAQRLIKISYRPEHRHLKAISAFNALGLAASNAVPALILIFDKNLGPFQQQAVPAIIARMGPAAQEAIPVMLRGLTHTNAMVRNNCIAALGKIQGKPTLVVPVLIKCLDDPVIFVRTQAACSLGKFGKEAQSAVPALLELRRKEILTATPGAGMNGFFETTINEDWSLRYPTVSNNPDVVKIVTEAVRNIEPEALKNTRSDTNPILLVPNSTEPSFPDEVLTPF